jgi:hypothetical protein
MELTVNVEGMPAKIIALEPSAVDGHTVYVPSKADHSSAPAHVVEAMRRGIEEARKPSSYAVFFTAAWTNWRPFLWQCLETAKEAEEASWILNSFLRSTNAPFGQTWAVSTAAGEDTAPFGTIEGNTPVDQMASKDSMVLTHKQARLMAEKILGDEPEIATSYELSDVTSAAKQMGERTRARLWGSTPASGAITTVEMPEMLDDADVAGGTPPVAPSRV